MRKITGYLCKIGLSGTLEQAEILFGANTGANERSAYANFCGNGLIPFATITAARQARRELRSRRNFRKAKVSIVRIFLRLAETQEELARFEHRKRGLCVVTEARISTWLVGRNITEGLSPRYPLYGCLLTENGFKTFLSDGHGTAYEKALWVAGEDSRQAKSPSTIGSFRMCKA